MGMIQEEATCGSFIILSCGVGRGRALDQLVCLSRVVGGFGTGHLGLWPRVETSESLSLVEVACKAMSE